LTNGFNLPDIFREGRTPPPKTKGKGRTGRIGNKGKKFDSMVKMQNDSIMQSKGMGIDRPRKDLGIETFDMPRKNPLNVGLNFGNLGIDTFNVNESAFSGRVIDEGIGATPVARSALGGAANLGGDFITQVTGKKGGVPVKGTGFGGNTEDDFLKVAGRSFGSGAPRIVGREPTVAGARASARASLRGVSQPPSNDIRDLNILGGIESFAGGIGRSATAITLAERKQKKARERITKSKLITTLKQRASREEADINPFRIYERKKVFKRKGEEDLRKGTEFADEMEDEFIEDESKRGFTPTDEEQAERFRQSQFRRARKPFDIDESEPSRTRARRVEGELNVEEIKEQMKRKMELESRLSRTALPFSSQFDTDGDGDIDTLGSGIPKAVFGEIKPVRITSRNPFPTITKPKIKTRGAFETKQEFSEFITDSTGRPVTIERERELIQQKEKRAEEGRLRLEKEQRLAKQSKKKKKRSK